MLKKLIVCILALSTLFVNAQDQKTEFGKVTIEELKQEYYPLDSTAHAAYLSKDHTLRCLSEFGSWSHETEVSERIKIYDNEGFQWATKEIPYFNSKEGTKERISDIEAYTYILENGAVKKIALRENEIFEEDKSDKWKQKKFTMPALQKGAVVEWRYKIKSPFVLHIDKLELQSDIPILKSSSVLVLPEYFVFKLYKTGTLPIEINKFSREMNLLRGDENIYLINTDSVPAFKEEVFMSNRKNFISSVDFNLSHVQFPGSEKKEYAESNWEEVAKKIFKTYEYKDNLKKRKYFEDDFLALELETKSAKEKIAIILEHVKSKIKWNESFSKGISTDLGVKKAYDIGEGNAIDINLVLTAMLKQAGFKASPVMISTREHGVSLFPSVKAYNYMITAVEGVEKELILLDATEKFSYLNVLPYRTINWYGRLIREDLTSQNVYVTPKVYVVEAQQMNVKIQEDLQVTGVLKSTYTMQNALDHRKEFNHLSQDDHKKMISDQYKIQVKNIRTMFKNDLEHPYIKLIEFSVEDAVEKINENLYIEPLFFLTKKSNPFKLEKRDYPVEFGYPWKDNYRIVIEIPEGYSVSYLPKGGSYTMAENNGSYSYQITQSGNLIDVLFSLQCDTGIVSPEFYNQLKEMYGTLVKEQSEKIVLQKNK